MSKTGAAKNTDEYIKQFPPTVQKALEKIRKTVKAAAPGAEEVISYQMPALKYHGMLVYYAAWKTHIGFYPAASVVNDFKKDLAGYVVSKGTIQFPLDQPLPLGLISDIVKFRVLQNEEKFAEKKASKTSAGTSSKTGIATTKTAAKQKTTKAKTVKPSDEEQVSNWLNQLEPEVRKEIDALRKIIKTSSSQLNERIKWNAPSYRYLQLDIVTFGPHKTHKLLLVFHHPEVVKIASPLLEGDYKDRRLVHFKSKADAEKNKKEIARIINEIIKSIDNK